MDDLISRQDAIKAVTYGALSSATLFGRSDAGMTALRETVRAIEQLPSAQPEIIRCKDCKHWNKSELLCVKWDYYISNEDFYCGCAERRQE